MTDEEVNKIIAEFEYPKSNHIEINELWVCMYFDYVNETNYFDFMRLPLYTSSLDSLVPVWEKLEFLEYKVDWFPDNEYQFKITSHGIHHSKNLTMQQAAAYATAKAIKSL